MKISVVDLAKTLGGRDIFKNFSLEIDSGMRLCVCGPNGVGKSTFLRMLAGVEEPDAGRILIPRDCRLGYVEQELSGNALDSTLMSYILGGVHDWGDFWENWERLKEAVTSPCS